MLPRVSSHRKSDEARCARRRFLSDEAKASRRFVPEAARVGTQGYTERVAGRRQQAEATARPSAYRVADHVLKLTQARALHAAQYADQ